MIEFPGLTEAEADELNEVILSELKELGYDLDRIVAGDRCEEAFVSVAACFPPWLVVEQRELCLSLPLELTVMAKDRFRHRLDHLSGLFVQNALEEWVELERSEIGMATSSSPNYADKKHHLERLEYLARRAFSDRPPLVELANAALEETHVARQTLKARACFEYLHLMPRDIRVRLLAIIDESAGIELRP